MVRKALVFSLLLIIGFCQIRADDKNADIKAKFGQFAEAHHRPHRQVDVTGYLSRENDTINRDAERRAKREAERAAERTAEIVQRMEYVKRGVSIVHSILSGFDLYSTPMSTATDILAPTFEAESSFDMQKSFATLSTSISQISYDIEKAQKSIPQSVEIAMRLRDYAKGARYVDDVYEEVSEIVLNQTGMAKPLESKNYPHWRIKIGEILKSIHNDFFVKHVATEDLIGVMTKHYSELYSCNTKSQQRQFYDLMTSILGTEAKGLNVLLHVFAKRLKRDNDRELEQKKAIQKSLQRMTTVVNTFKVILKDASRTLQACDLKDKHVKDKTYTKLEGVLERVGYFPYRAQSCSVLENTIIPSYNPGESSKVMNNQRRCSKVVECFQMPFSEFCLSKNQADGPRYQYVKHYRDAIPLISHFTRRGDCYSDMVSSLEFENIIGAPLCDCICDESAENGTGDRYFSLEDVTSNVNLNRVVTGVRFNNVENTVYLQVEEGTLMPSGVIYEPSRNWVPIKNYTGNTIRPQQVFQFSWPNARGLALKTVEAPSNHVVTGVKFSQKTAKDPSRKGIDGYQRYLNLEIRVTEFDPKTGKLLPETTYWMGSDHRVSKVSHLFDVDKPNPTAVGTKHRPTNDEFVLFEPTSIFSDDTGYSLVPTLDIQPVASSGLAAPLSAVGIQLLHADDSGDFVALKAETLDVMQFLSQTENQFLNNAS